MMVLGLERAIMLWVGKTMVPGLGRANLRVVSTTVIRDHHTLSNSAGQTTSYCCCYFTITSNVISYFYS